MAQGFTYSLKTPAYLFIVELAPATRSRDSGAVVYISGVYWGDQDGPKIGAAK